MLAGLPSLQAATSGRKRGSYALTPESLQGYPRASRPSLDYSVTRHTQQKSLLPRNSITVGPGVPVSLSPAL